MERANWYDRSRGRPLIEEQLYKLRGYMDALADGVIDADEMEAQERRVLEAMKAVEPDLDDGTHARVTTLLLEMTAYNVMRLLHELHRQRRAAERAKS